MVCFVLYFVKLSGSFRLIKKIHSYECLLRIFVVAKPASVQVIHNSKTECIEFKASFIRIICL